MAEKNENKILSDEKDWFKNWNKWKSNIESEMAQKEIDLNLWQQKAQEKQMHLQRLRNENKNLNDSIERSRDSLKEISRKSRCNREVVDIINKNLRALDERIQNFGHLEKLIYRLEHSNNKRIKRFDGLTKAFENLRLQSTMKIVKLKQIVSKEEQSIVSIEFQLEDVISELESTSGSLDSTPERLSCNELSELKQKLKSITLHKGNIAKSIDKCDSICKVIKEKCSNLLDLINDRTQKTQLAFQEINDKFNLFLEKTSTNKNSIGCVRTEFDAEIEELKKASAQYDSKLIYLQKIEANIAEYNESINNTQHIFMSNLLTCSSLWEQIEIQENLKRESEAKLSSMIQIVEKCRSDRDHLLSCKEAAISEIETELLSITEETNHLNMKSTKLCLEKEKLCVQMKNSKEEMSVLSSTTAELYSTPKKEGSPRAVRRQKIAFDEISSSSKRMKSSMNMDDGVEDVYTLMKSPFKQSNDDKNSVKLGDKKFFKSKKKRKPSLFEWFNK